LSECGQEVHGIGGRPRAHEADYRQRALLRASRELPRGRAAEERDELAPPDVEHWDFLRPIGAAAALMIPAIDRPGAVGLPHSSLPVEGSAGPWGRPESL